MWPLPCAVLIVLACLYLFGRFEPGTDALAHALGLPANSDSLLVWTRTAGNNAVLVERRWESGDYSSFDIAAISLIIVSLMVLLVELARNAGFRRLSFMAPVCVLPLYALGVDYARWTELLYFTVIVVVAVSMLERWVAPEKMRSRMVQIALVILVFVPAVPFGTEHALGLLFGKY